MTSTHEHACDQERGTIPLTALAAYIETLQASTVALAEDFRVLATRLECHMRNLCITHDHLERHINAKR